MIVKIAALVGLSGVLNYATQLKDRVVQNKECLDSTTATCDVLKQEGGFPISYTQDIDGMNNFAVASFTGNWLIWLVIAGILMIVLSKILEFFGNVALFVAVVGLIAVFFGIITL